MTNVAAPAVHVDKWKHWSWSEGKNRIARTLPDGCGVAIIDDQMFFEDLRSGRFYELPPLPPDAREWAEANKDDLRGGKNWLRRQAEQRAMQQRKPSATPLTGPFNWAGNYYYWILTYPKSQWIAYMTAFMGVAQLPQTLQGAMGIWVGLQPPTGSYVLQATLDHEAASPANVWLLGTEVQGPGINDVKGSRINFIQGQGIWGVVRAYGGPGYWLIQSFRGNAGNTGPAFGKPVGASTQVFFSNKLYPQNTRLTEAVCSFEVVGDGGVTNVPYLCSDISVQAVFGGVTVQHGPDLLPVNWAGHGVSDYPGGANALPCGVTPSISNPSSNGRTQLSVAIASS